VVNTFQYLAFGQVISSDFPIDVLPPAHEESPTIQVQLAQGVLRGGQAEDPFFDISDERQYFEWDAVGAFEITAANCIRVEPKPGVSWRLVSQPLLGIVISVVLERLGKFCLHGGSVNVNGKAVILLGDKGVGKSTTVSSLLQQGHRLLTDDLVALDCDNQSRAPEVQTGFPAVKLWPDSANALAVDTSTGAELIHPSITKIQKQIGTDLMAKPTPADTIFILSPNDQGETHSERMTEIAALESLLYFAFIARFGNASLGRAHLGKFMQRCCYVVKTTPVYLLHIRRDLNRLDDLAAEIIKRSGQGVQPVVELQG